MQFSVMQTQVRERLLEGTARFFTDAQIKAYLNSAYADFVARTKWPTRVTAIAAVANQYEYALASNTMKVHKVKWEDQYTLWPKKDWEFDLWMGSAVDSESTRPEIYTAYPWDRRIRVYPIPSTASDATAINDAGNMSSSATSVTVDSTTDFPNNGILIIESEQVLYYAKTATSFTQLVRGHGGTTAATHLDNVAVTLGSIQVYNSYMPADMSADADLPLINTEYHEALVWYAVQLGLFKRQRYKESEIAFEKYMEIVQRANRDRLQESMEGHEHVRDCDTEQDYL